MAIAGLLAWLALAPNGVAGDENRISLADAGNTTATEEAKSSHAETPEHHRRDRAGEQPAAEPVAATQPAPSGWPPGLMMQGLDAIGLGKPMQDLGLRAYGYVESGMTFRMTGPSPNPQNKLFLRGFETRRPNNLLLNQLNFTLDRPVDTSKQFDLGGRFDFMYGTDCKYYHSLGMFDTNQLERNVNYDIPVGYGEMWIKTGGAGTGFDIIFGKWYTTIGAETAYAPANWLYSRSLLNVYAEPAEHTGLKVAYQFDPNNSVYLGVVRGWDQFKDANQMASWMAGFTLSGKEKMGSNPRSQLAFNFIIGPEQAGRLVGENRLLADTVWTWRWTEKLTQVMNFDYGWEDDVPGALNSEKVPHRADAAWYGLSYMLNYVINDYVSTTGRTDWFTDNAGVRTGYRGTFFETTVGLCITPFPKDKILSNFMFRPEIRADWSTNDSPFAERCQWTGGFDVMYRF